MLQSALGTLLAAYLVAGLLAGLATLLFIIPGIYVYVMYSLIAPVVVIEGVKSDESRRRSWFLVKDNWWRVFVVILVFAMLAGMLTYGVHSTISLISADLATNIIVTNAIEGIISIFMTPLTIIAVILLYYDLRIRKEGFDLEMLSQSLQQTEQPGTDTDSGA